MIGRTLASSGFCVCHGQDIRILRPLDVDRRVAAPNDNGAGHKIAVVIDVETTGTDFARDVVIELSLRRVRFDDDGVIARFDRSYSWLEDPGRPLDPAISVLTGGLTDADLHNQRIDDEVATKLIRSAHAIIAFNAAFDRPFVERRLPAVAEARLPWCCAMREVAWQANGFDGSGRSLGWILAQCGWYNGRAHRAAGDVDATIAILEHRFASGNTALFELLETAAQPTWLISAIGAHFDVKDSLKARGYRWDPTDRVWSREVTDGDRAEEETWLAENVYAPQWRPRMDGPSLREVTWFNRHA